MAYKRKLKTHPATLHPQVTRCFSEGMAPNSRVQRINNFDKDDSPAPGLSSMLFERLTGWTPELFARFSSALEEVAYLPTVEEARV